MLLRWIVGLLICGVRVVHSFTGRVLLEATHPRLGQVRVFLLKQWTWDNVRSTLPEGYSKFNVDLIYNSRTLHALRALMSLTDEDTLEIGYVIKELWVPSPRALRDMTEAISRHQADLVYNYLSRYKVPELVRVLRGETINPLTAVDGTMEARGRCATMSESTGVASSGSLFS